MGLVIWIVIIYFIVSAVKKNVKDNTANNQGRVNNGNVSYQRQQPQQQPDKYKTINSHYSQSTLQGTAGSQSSPLAGQFVAGTTANDHKHAYEHKVQPIDEASVHNRFEDRKEAYRERKAQMKADLPKTSYSKTEASVKSNATSTKYKTVEGIFAKNGDYGNVPASNEVSTKCGYCGAINIVPRSRRGAYKCYFCREEV